mgnify:FL=1
MDYVIDDISLIGLADEKEYPVAEEYQPNGSNLDLVWEWGHNPDNRYWSLTDREGWLRLTNGHKVSATAKYMKGTYGDLTYFETARNVFVAAYLWRIHVCGNPHGCQSYEGWRHRRPRYIYP